MSETTLPAERPERAAASAWSPFEASFRELVSLDRLLRYRRDRDGGAWAPVIGRYMYNVEVARTLHPVLHWAEIALRNRLDRVIAAAYPVGGARSYADVRSWLDASPPVLLPRDQARVVEAKRQLKGAAAALPGRARRPLTAGKLVAELSFGFWTHLLDGAYENWRISNRLWPALLEPAFPHCPPAERTRRHIHARFQEIKTIRNRTFHHERITHQVSMGLYDRFVEAIAWIDPHIADALAERERASFVTLLRDGPVPFVEWAARRAA